MAKHSSSTSPFKDMEEEAYHAFLEWPIWLALREKELAGYLAKVPTDRSQTDARTAQSTRAGSKLREEQ